MWADTPCTNHMLDISTHWGHQEFNWTTAGKTEKVGQYPIGNNHTTLAQMIKMGKIDFFMEKENHLKPFGFFLENLVMKQQENMFKSTLVLLSIIIQVIE